MAHLALTTTRPQPASSTRVMPQEHAGKLTRPHSLTWKIDDGRGRDVFRGNMSTHLAPNGRCHFDPKLAPISTPGPTSCTDEIQPARKVPGLAFGRCTESRVRRKQEEQPKPKRKPKEKKKAPAPSSETYELFGMTYDMQAQPVAPKSPKKDSLKALQALERRHTMDMHGMGEPESHGTTFLTADRKTMLSLKPNTVVSPGPVYDLRTKLGRDVKAIRPAAFPKERKFEQARFEGTYRPPSFTPGPLTHEPYVPQTKPCSVLMIEKPSGAVAEQDSVVSAF